VLKVLGMTRNSFQIYNKVTIQRNAVWIIMAQISNLSNYYTLY